MGLDLKRCGPSLDPSEHALPLQHIVGAAGVSESTGSPLHSLSQGVITETPLPALPLGTCVRSREKCHLREQ